MTPRSRTGVAGSRGAPVGSGDAGISVVAAAWGVCVAHADHCRAAARAVREGRAHPGTRRESRGSRRASPDTLRL